MTDELFNQIHEAMQAAGGNAPKAAEILGCPSKKLYNWIHHTPELKAVWTRKSQIERPPGVEIEIHRPVPPPKTRDQAIAEALGKEDLSIKKGLSAIGVTGAALDLAVALQQLHQRHFQSTIEMLGGGVTKQFIECQAEVEAITRRINADPPPENEGLLRMDRQKLMELMLKFYSAANGAVLTQAKVKQMSSASHGNARAGKPGFAPLIAIKADNVQLTETSQKTADYEG